MSISCFPTAAGLSAEGLSEEGPFGLPAGLLTEILPAEPGDGAAALGFALGWAQSLCPSGLIVWAVPEIALAEGGAPYAEGLAQFGLSLDRLLIVRTRTQGEALWAAEQALTLPHTLGLVTVAPARKPLSLTATRRLLLITEKHATRCVLLRFDGVAASAAHARWRVKAAPSIANDRELGAPAFRVELARNRAGPAGFTTLLSWNAHARQFDMDGALAAASADGQAQAQRQSA